MCVCTYAHLCVSLSTAADAIVYPLFLLYNYNYTASNFEDDGVLTRRSRFFYSSE